VIAFSNANLKHPSTIPLPTGLKFASHYKFSFRGLAVNRNTPLFETLYSRKQQILFYIAIVFLTVASFTLGYLVCQFMATRSSAFPLFQEAYSIFRDHAYAGPPPQTRIEYGMIRGMLASSNDPFTTFAEPPQSELQTNQLQGKFGGVGVRIEQDIRGNFLVYPLPDSPALSAGLQDGDRLVSVDKFTLTPATSLDEVQAGIRGPINSWTILKIERGSSQEIREFKLQRVEVALPSVSYNLASSNPMVGVIHVSIIAETSADEIANAIAALQDNGAKFFVLDLRNNGGGIVDGGVDCARLFLGQNLTIIDEQFRGESIKSYKVNHTGRFQDLPLIVLVNQNTASAAEILAGTLQYNQRARLIGSKTYGKDSVQMVFDLSDGSSLHVTAGKWWLPNQEGLLGGKGLSPDIELAQEEAGSPAGLEKAVNEVIP
jgi:carboxyl-terminal processing protease